MCVSPVLGGDTILDEGLAGDMQLFHLVERRAHGGPDWRLEHRAETGEHGRIDPIRLGMRADSLGEASGLPRIDLDERQPGLGQAALESAVISPGWFEDDPRHRKVFEPGDEAGESFGGVRQAAGQTGGKHMDIKGFSFCRHADPRPSLRAAGAIDRCQGGWPDGSLLRRMPEKSATTEEWLESIRREDAGRALVNGVVLPSMTSRRIRRNIRHE